VQRVAQSARYTTSVCTGALVLARAGLLAGRRATTHWAAYDFLESLGEGVKVVRDVRVVKDGIFSSAGVSAGIDMAFALVEEICGASVANETAHYIEYLRR
jgi:transcriptional regulator GlxA family with amidase domain